MNTERSRRVVAWGAMPIITKVRFSAEVRECEEGISAKHTPFLQCVLKANDKLRRPSQLKC